MLQRKTSLLKFLEAFPDDASCKKYLEYVYWNNKPQCFHCGNKENIYRIETRNIFKCSKCRKQFSVLSGTIFEGSKISLVKWFTAYYLMSIHKKGISSCQLAKDIEVTQKTAWTMLMKIREGFGLLKQEYSLENDVEVDETYVGGKNKNKHYNKKTKGVQGRNCTDKIAVFGMLERGGKCITKIVNDVSANTLKSEIYSKVEYGSNINSDEWTSYNGLNKVYNHNFVSHGKYEFVNGSVHTNGMENYWSLAKRSILGIYHHVSRKHCNRYFAEFDFRYNTRGAFTNNTLFLAMLKSNQGRKSYEEITK